MKPHYQAGAKVNLLEVANTSVFASWEKSFLFSYNAMKRKDKCKNFLMETKKKSGKIKRCILKQSLCLGNRKLIL